MKTLFLINLFLIQLCLIYCVLKVYDSGRFVLGIDNHLKVQGTHSDPTPRIGGILIIVCLSGSTFFSPAPDSDYTLLQKALVSLTPLALAAGIEDLTGSDIVWTRLFAAILSALILTSFGDVRFSRTELSLVDEFFSSFPLAILGLTVLTVVAMTNSVNIIDGFNGLASAVCLTGLIGLGYFFYLENMTNFGFEILQLICVLLAFSIFNFPRAHFFLGDCGAYTLGFLLASYGITVIQKTQISPYAVLLVFTYPAVEITFSFFRKLIEKNSSPLKPDAYHLHLMIYQLFLRKVEQSDIPQKFYNFINPCVTLSLLPIILGPLCLALIDPYNTFLMTGSFGIVFLFYSLFYLIVRRFIR